MDQPPPTSGRGDALPRHRLRLGHQGQDDPMTHNPAFEGARWAYAAYTLNPKIAAERGITQADMIGFASVPYKSEPRASRIVAEG